MPLLPPRTADLGTFRLEYVTMGDFTLEGFDPTTERTGRGGGRLSTNGETVTSDVIVTPRGTVKGLVLNNSGSAPIANASVSISVTGVAGYNYSTTTGPDGGFLFTGVPAGKYSLDARDPSNNLHGYANGTITYENEISQATVKIAPTGSIEGAVYLPDGRTPAVNAFIQFTNGTGRRQVDPVDGSFQYTNLAAGRGLHLLLLHLGAEHAPRGQNHGFAHHRRTGCGSTHCAARSGHGHG